MATDHLLKCQCGQPVAASDVQRIMLLLVGETPAWYYCKYRCHHCHRVGQELIRPDDWEPAELFLGGDQLVDRALTSRQEDPPAQTRSRRQRPAGGQPVAAPITTDEVIDFALALQAMTAEDLEAACAFAPDED